MTGGQMRDDQSVLLEYGNNSAFRDRQTPKLLVQDKKATVCSNMILFDKQDATKMETLAGKNSLLESVKMSKKLQQKANALAADSIASSP